MNNNVEDQLNEMISDLNAVNDDFINDYFELEEKQVKNEIDFEMPEDIELNNDEIEFDMDEESENKDTKEEKQEVTEVFKESEEKEEKQKKVFSYNDILSRLDHNEKKIDINNTNDLMKLIEKTETADEFFDTIEEAMEDDQ